MEVYQENGEIAVRTRTDWRGFHSIFESFQTYTSLSITRMNMFSIFGKKFHHEENSLFALIIKMQVSAIRHKKSFLGEMQNFNQFFLSKQPSWRSSLKVVWLLIKFCFVLWPGGGGGGGGGVTPRKVGWGYAARFPKPLPYLQPKLRIFS